MRYFKNKEQYAYICIHVIVVIRSSSQQNHVDTHTIVTWLHTLLLLTHVCIYVCLIQWYPIHFIVTLFHWSRLFLVVTRCAGILISVLLTYVTGYIAFTYK